MAEESTDRGLQITRRGAVAATAIGLGGCLDVAHSSEEPEWNGGDVPDLSGLESVEYRATGPGSDSVKYHLRLGIDDESDIRKIRFAYESPSGSGGSSAPVAENGWEAEFSAVNAPIFSLVAYDSTEKNSIDWMWNVDVWFLCGAGDCSLKWEGEVKES